MGSAVSSDAAPVAKRGGMQLIARAADVLRELEREPDGLALSELARSAGLAKSTTHRLIVALQDEDFVRVGADGRWRLGPGVAQLGAAARETLREELRPHILRLAREVDETVDLSVLDGAGARFIDQIPCTRRLAAVSAVGAIFPLHSTANGKALLAAMRPDQAAALLPTRLNADTKRSATSRRALRAELEAVRKRGIAYDREEHTDGIAAVGAVVRDAYGVAAAISIAAPVARFEEAKERLAACLTETCAGASRVLGAASQGAGS